MAKKVKNKRLPTLSISERPLVMFSGKFAVTGTTGLVPGGNTAVFNGVDVYKLARSGTYDIQHNMGSTAVYFQATFNQNGFGHAYSVKEDVRSSSGSQISIQNSGSLVDDTTGDPSISFVGFVQFGGNS